MISDYLHLSHCQSQSLWNQPKVRKIQNFNIRKGFSSLNKQGNYHIHGLNNTDKFICWLKTSCRSAAAATLNSHTSMLQRSQQSTRALKILAELGSKDIMNSDSFLRNLQVPRELLHLAKLQWQIGKEQIEGLVHFHSISLFPRSRECVIYYMMNALSLALC